MTERQFAYMVRYCNALGIRTFGQLARYKKEKGITDNGRLIAEMYQDVKAMKSAS